MILSSSAGFALAQLATLAIDELPQIVEELLVPFSQHFDKKRKRERRGWTRIEQLAKSVARRPDLILHS